MVYGARFLEVAGGVLVLAALGCASERARAPFPVDPNTVVDLTYAFDQHTIYWPTAESFELRRVSYGVSPAGYWYAANNICMAEHGGTHMDAPIHFAKGKDTTDQVPLGAGIGPAAVIDVRAQAAADRDYRLRVEDLTRWEAEHGRLPTGVIVVMWSGWGRYWGDKLHYLGTDRQGDVGDLHFPGFSREAVEFLLKQRDISAIAVDTASIDYGPSTDFIVHQLINGANKPAFENVAHVDRLPSVGATFLALPMKIAGGSGGPARIIAILP